MKLIFVRLKKCDISVVNFKQMLKFFGGRGLLHFKTIEISVQFYFASI